jgi:homoserine/homoserine lactone efflux protein
MSFEAWLAFCLTETVLCFTPGPAVLLVVSVGLSGSFRRALASALGILTANALYFAISAAGVGAAILASARLFSVIKWLGAAYLVWMGLRMIFSHAPKTEIARPVSHRGNFVKGVVVQGANPKALVFFTALLPQFVAPTAPVAPQVFLLGISSVFIELCVLTLYATLAANGKRWAGARFATAMERIGGGFLVAAGARLALTRSNAS